MIADLLSPWPEVNLGRIRWKVIFTHRILLRLERESGLDVLGGEFSLGNANSQTLQLILRVTSGREDLPWEELRPGKLSSLLGDLRKAWELSMPEADPNAEGPPSNVTGWVEAWANAHECLRMAEDEWLDSTPRMVQVLSRYRLESLRQGEWMLAQIGSLIVNWSMGAPKSPVKTSDFMLHPWADTESDLVQTPESVLRQFSQAKWVDHAGKKAIAEALLPSRTEPLN